MHPPWEAVQSTAPASILNCLPFLMSKKWEAVQTRGGPQLFSDGGGVCPRFMSHFASNRGGPNFSHSAIGPFCVTQDGKFQGPYPARLFPSCGLSLFAQRRMGNWPGLIRPQISHSACSQLCATQNGNRPRRPEPRRDGLPRPRCPASGTFLAFRRFWRAFRRFVAPVAFGFGFGGTMRPGSRFGPLSRALYLRFCRCRYRPWGETSRKNQT